MAATKTNRPGTMRTAIIGACGLLGLGGATAHANEVKTAVFAYTEPNRVSAFEALVDGTYDFADGKTANVHFVFDSLTGASANGATPASFAQTFTTPSGGLGGDDKRLPNKAAPKGSYHTTPGETPLDDSFADARFALSTGLTFPVQRLTNLNLGVYGSAERDYLSLGANTALTHDFNQRNTTVALRAGFSHDSSKPLGGRPVPFSAMLPALVQKPVLPGNGAKQIVDLGLGVTQVIDRKTVFHLNYTYSTLNDYLTDPYKVVTVVDPVTGDPRATDPYLYESRPDARAKHSIFARLVRHLGPNVAHLSYRYFSDDWGIRSQMADATFRWQLSPKNYLQPHLRYYTQSGADFYRRYLVDGQARPDHASADYRLGKMHTVTYGLVYGHVGDNNHTWTVRFEYYAQMGEHHPPDAIGNLANYDLFPTISALVMQVGYSFDFLQ